LQEAFASGGSVVVSGLNTSEEFSTISDEAGFAVIDASGGVERKWVFISTNARQAVILAAVEINGRTLPVLAGERYGEVPLWVLQGDPTPGVWMTTEAAALAKRGADATQATLRSAYSQALPRTGDPRDLEERLVDLLTTGRPVILGAGTGGADRLNELAREGGFTVIDASGSAGNYWALAALDAREVLLLTAGETADSHVVMGVKYFERLPDWWNPRELLASWS